MKKVVIISGKLRSGKDTIAKFMRDYFEEKELTLVHEYFAKRLKEGVIKDFAMLKNVVNEQVDTIIRKNNLDHSPSIKQALLDFKWSDENYFDEKTPITRALLQIYGTEIFRERVNNNHWVDLVIDAINESDEKYFVLTDARFENEIYRVFDKCKNAEIITLRMERDMERDKTQAEHPSETGLDDFIGWNYIIDNNGSLEELEAAAKSISDEIICTDVE